MLLTVEKCHHFLCKKSIVPFFQPIYDAEKKVCTGAEILARLPYANNVMLTPDCFLPNMMSVKSQRILTRTILKKTHSLLKNCTLPPGFILTFNISANMIGCSWLTVTCNKLLRCSNNTISLVAEITERDPLTMDYLIWLSHRKYFRKSGLSIAIDDFGIGYSNFLMLKQTEAEYIKIPYEFISDMKNNTTSMHIVDSTIQLGNTLGIKIIAEGVETKEQYKVLRNKGVILMQGFYFSPPLCLVDFIQHMNCNKK